MISSIRFKWNKFSPPPKKLLPRYLLKARSWGGVPGGPVRRVLRACKRYIDLWRVCWRAGGFFFLHPPRGCAKPSPFRHSQYQSGNKLPAPPTRTGRGKTHIHTHRNPSRMGRCHARLCRVGLRRLQVLSLDSAAACGNSSAWVHSSRPADIPSCKLPP